MDPSPPWSLSALTNMEEFHERAEAKIAKAMERVIGQRFEPLERAVNFMSAQNQIHQQQLCSLIDEAKASDQRFGRFLEVASHKFADLDARAQRAATGTDAGPPTTGDRSDTARVLPAGATALRSNPEHPDR
jgi:hypothetical protein